MTIIDSNNPSVALDQFIVSSSHLLCMAAVAGLGIEDAASEGIARGNVTVLSTCQLVTKSINKTLRSIKLMYYSIFNMFS